MYIDEQYIRRKNVQCALYIQTAENQNNAIKNIEDVAGLGPWIHNNKCLFRSTNLILGTPDLFVFLIGRAFI